MLSNLLGKAATFKRSISDYDVFGFPHLGEGKNLSDQQQVENLAYFLSIKDERARMVISKLAELGTHVPPPGEVSVAASVSKALHEFSSSTLAKVHRIEATCAPYWRERSREGLEARVFSFVADLGIYCGECANHSDLGFDWRIDDTDYSPADRMPTYGNVNLSHISNVGPSPRRLFHDVMDWTMFRVADDALARKGKALQMLNSFSFLEDLLDGRY